MSRADRWVVFVERHYRRILLGSLLLAVLSGLSLTRLRLDIDVLSMLPVGAPAFDNFKTFVSDFGQLDELVILLEADEAQAVQRFADAFAPLLGALDSVVNIQGKLDQTRVIDGLLGRYRYNYIPLEAYDRLAAELTPEGIDAKVRGARQLLQAPLDLSSAQWVRRDPLGFTRLAAQSIDAAFSDRRVNVQGGYLSSADGKAVLLLVRPARSAFDSPFTASFMAQVHAAEARVRAVLPEAGDVRVGYTGSYAFALEDAATIKADVARYSVLALCGVLVVFFAGYRNLRILPFVTYPLLLSTLLTFAAGIVVYDQLNAVSLSFAAILYGLSIDSGIHYYTRLLQEREQRPLREALSITLQRLAGANLVASFTTATAFFVIGYSQLVGISQLGMLSGIGLLINIVQFFVLYPALSFAMSDRVLSKVPLDTPRLGRIAGTSSRHARVVLLVVGLASLACAWIARDVDFDVDLMHLRPGESEAGRVQERLADRFGADAAGNAVLVRAPSLEEALQASESVQARLAAYRQENLVQQVQSLAPLLPSERAQRQRLERFVALPRARIVTALQESLDRHGFRADAFSGLVAELETPRPHIVRAGDPELAPFAALIDRYLRQQGDTFTVASYVQLPAHVRLPDLAVRLQADLPDVQLIPASRAWLETELGRLLHRELVWFCVAAFVFNLLLVLPGFPSLSMAAAILIPETLVILTFFALVTVSGIGIGPVNLIVVPLILGIGVDYCVYVAERIQHGASPAEALRRGGRALSISAFTTMTGFGFLALSRYPALAHMGELAAISLFLCLCAAVVVLPALLAVWGPVRTPPDLAANPGRGLAMPEVDR